MLVLTRSSNAGVQIGDEIEVVVLEIKGDTVKLGFSAPNQSASRSEIAEQVSSENQNSAVRTASLNNIAFPALEATS